MANKYKAKFKDITKVNYSLEIYKTYTDTIKEVRLVDNPQIECKTPDYIIDGGLCTTGVKFSLLGTNTDDLMTLALSELTEYKVLIKNTDLNSVVYFGYLINGVYEVDFSLYNNYPVDFAASDFKVFEDTKACANGLTDILVSFNKLFEKTCMYNDFKDIVNINLTTCNLTTKYKYGGNNINPVYSAGLTNTTLVDKSSLYDEKGVPINDFNILDGLLRMYSYTLMQYNGELYIYEVGKSNEYNDTLNLALSNFNSTSTLQPSTGVNSWSVVNIPTDIKYNGSQNLEITTKIDRLKLKPNYDYKDNYYDSDYGINEDLYEEIILKGTQVAYYKNGTIYRQMVRSIESNYYNPVEFSPNSLFLMQTTDDKNFTTWTVVSGAAGNVNNTDTITFRPNNTYAYTQDSSVGLKVRLTFDTYIKGRYPDPISDYVGGNVTLSGIGGNTIETKRYRCYPEAGGIIYRDAVVKTVTVDEARQLNRDYTDAQRREFIFNIPVNTSSLENLVFTFRKPYFTQSYSNISSVDFWGVDNVNIELVYETKLNTYESYKEVTAKEVVVESTTLVNNYAKEESLDYDYIFNRRNYTLLRNTLFENREGVNRSLDYVLETRTGKLTTSNWIPLQDSKVAMLFKQLNQRRIKLTLNVLKKDNTTITPVKYYALNSISNKSFIMSGYSYDICDKNIELQLEEFIK